MTNYKYLKENNLFEAHLKFKRALGESFGFSPLEEADDDDQNNAQGGGQDPMAGGVDPNAGGGMPPMGDPNGGMGGADPNAVGGMPGDPNAGGMPPIGDPNAAGGGQDPMAGGADPNVGGMPPMDDSMGGLEEEPQEEDEVIDVEDITDAEEKIDDKVNSVGRDLGKVDTRIDKLIGAIDKLQGLFDRNNQEIADLKAEFEKRNPTQTEKLNLRSLDSYPFKIKPTDYWAEKAQNGNYSAYADNDVPTTQEYVITNNDVDDFSEREISDTFSDIDDFDLDIKKIFGI